MEQAEDTPKKDGEIRDKRGRYAPGHCGGPGRRKGVGHADLLRDAMGDDLPKIFDKLREQALGGDPAAIRLIIDKIIPARKPVEEPIEVDMPEKASLTEMGFSILRAVGVGELAPTQGAALVGALGQLARVAEVDEILRRIEALEQRNAKS